jgi:thiol-disulfide isomerase/thioredoxin
MGSPEDRRSTGLAGAARGVLRLAGIAALLGLLVWIMVGTQRPLEEGRLAPPVENARGLDGKVGNLSLVRGQPVVVNIWATWCPPCLQEMPEFARASERYRGRVTFYGLAVDSPRPHVLQLVERMGIPYEIAEIDGATARAWNASSLPSTYILDGEGRIVWSVRGAIDGAVLDKRLAPLLGSGP